MNDISKLNDKEIIETLNSYGLNSNGNRYQLICRLYEHIKQFREESSDSEVDWDLLESFSSPELIILSFSGSIKQIKNKNVFYFIDHKRKLKIKEYNDIYSSIKNKRKNNNPVYREHLIAFKFTNKALWSEICSIASLYLEKSTKQAKRYIQTVIENKKLLILFF